MTPGRGLREEPPRNQRGTISSIPLARTGEVTQAIDTFHSNLPLLTEMASARIYDKIREFASTLRPHTDDDAIETRRIALSLIGESPHA